MRRHTRPYIKKRFQKEGTSQDPTACQVVEVRDGEILTRYLVKVSQSPCQKCQQKEHGRVFKIVGISEVYNLIEDESLSKSEAHKNIGRTFCIDCLS